MRIKQVQRTGIVNIVSQLVFLILIFIFGQSISLINVGQGRLLLLIGIILIPSIIWILYFYFQDRIEPEPFSILAASFISGLAAANLVVIPLFDHVFFTRVWIHSTTPFFIFGSFFVIAPVISSLIYLILRYGFYHNREFDEPVDGMVYGAIIGAGMAFIISLHYLSIHPNHTLFSIGYTATTNILVYSSTGSLIGYFIGTAKFCRKKIETYAFFGLFTGILLIGLYQLVNEFIFLLGNDQTFWISLILTIAYASIILTFTTQRMKKLTEQDLHKQIKPARKLDILVLVFILISISAAVCISQLGIRGKRFSDETYGITFFHPHRLSSFPSFTGVQPTLSLQDTSKILFACESQSDPHYAFTLTVHPGPAAGEEENPLQYLEISESENLLLQNSPLADENGSRLFYSYLLKAADFQGDFPKLLKFVTDVVHLNEYTYVFTLKTDAEDFKLSLAEYEKIIRSIVWHGPKEN